jgi:phytanoyl-CoA hydroxylase
MNDSELKARYDRDGFAIVPQFLPASLLAELRSQLDRYIRDVVPTLPDTHAFYEDKQRPETLKQLQNMATDPYFGEYRRQPHWLSLAEMLIGEPAHAKEPEWFDKPPGTNHVTPPHQDNFYFCLTPPHVVTLWLALDRVDEENGCLRYVRGSHRAGVRPHGRSNILGFSQGITDLGPADREREVSIFLEAGDLVLHHGNTIHRADANRSNTRHRRAFAVVFQGASCRRDEAAFTRYKAALEQQHKQLGLTV